MTTICNGEEFDTGALFRLIGVHCEEPGVADWFKESTITTRSLYSFNMLECSNCSLERSLCSDCCVKVSVHPQVMI
ncbi:hypothetical protein JOB18_038351 [Solea senegalensis]|uniref:Uncharacterized protein n=1 Tax=Solea senegalensis TaxID=28829 RepID=A0AAV6S0S3_SOLSE|nr:hypothetical protein JOB18_038351 [Solea senegalensis]